MMPPGFLSRVDRVWNLKETGSLIFLCGMVFLLATAVGLCLSFGRSIRKAEKLCCRRSDILALS